MDQKLHLLPSHILCFWSSWIWLLHPCQDATNAVSMIDNLTNITNESGVILWSSFPKYLTLNNSSVLFLPSFTITGSKEDPKDYEILNLMLPQIILLSKCNGILRPCSKMLLGQKCMQLVFFGLNFWGTTTHFLNQLYEQISNFHFLLNQFAAIEITFCG